MGWTGYILQIHTSCVQCPVLHVHTVYCICTHAYVQPTHLTLLWNHAAPPQLIDVGTVYEVQTQLPLLFL